MASSRRALALLAVLAVQVGAVDFCSSRAATATRTEEMTQGPYHLDLHPQALSANVTSGQAGVPLELNLTVLDTGCQPVVDALVEVWQANATGFYSGFPNQNPDPSVARTKQPAADAAQQQATAVFDLDQNFLRGVTATDEAGLAKFFTILPGRYMGRAVHIHYAVHIATNVSADVEAEFDGSYVTHIGQIFFPDELAVKAHLVWPYSTTSNASVTTLATDMVYTGDTNTIADLQQVSSSLADGLRGSMQAIVEPTHVEHFMEGGFGPGAPQSHWLRWLQCQLESTLQSVQELCIAAWQGQLPLTGVAGRQAKLSSARLPYSCRRGPPDSPP